MEHVVVGENRESGTDAEIHFYIPATGSLQERRPRTLKHADTFAVFDHYGDIIAGEGSPEGLFHQDTRFLSGLSLRINGQRPLLLSSTVADDNTRLTVDLTNPDFFSAGRLVLAKDTLHILRTKFLWQGACHERLAITNFDDRPHMISLELNFAADFADIFEVRGHKRQHHGNQTASADPNRVEFSYTGFDSVVRRTTVRFDRAPSSVTENRASFELELPSRRRSSLFVTVACNAPPDHLATGRHFFVGLRAARLEARRVASGAATVVTSNEVFNEILCRSMSDFYMLVTDTESGRVKNTVTSMPYAAPVVARIMTGHALSRSPEAAISTIFSCSGSGAAAAASSSASVRSAAAVMPSPSGPMNPNACTIAHIR